MSGITNMQYAQVIERLRAERDAAVAALREIAENPYGDWNLEFARKQAAAVLARIDGEQR